MPAPNTNLPILHVDMDAFFAEVERLKDPSLAKRAIIVGGTGGRGVVASASYEARANGVHSAMPIAQAQRLCPNAAFVSPTFELYSAASRNIREIFESFTPMMEFVGLDEAFLDVSGAHALFGSSEQIAWVIRAAISEATQLNCSIGVASNKALAKLASVAAKPRITAHGQAPGLGVCVLPVREQLRFLHALPVKALWGVGKMTERRLEEMGINTVGDLAAVPAAALTATFGVARGKHLERLAQGLDDRAVEGERVAKSIGHEETFATDVTDVAVMRSKITQLSDAVAWRLRRGGVTGRSVQLKVKLADFKIKTRVTTLPATEPAVDTATRIADIAMDLLHQLMSQLSPFDVAQGARLIGVSISHLEPAFTESVSADYSGTDDSGALSQLMLDLGVVRDTVIGDEQTHGTAATTSPLALAAEQRLAAAVDDIRGRFGGDAIGLGFGHNLANRPANPRANP